MKLTTYKLVIVLPALFLAGCSESETVNKSVDPDMVIQRDLKDSMLVAETLSKTAEIEKSLRASIEQISEVQARNLEEVSVGELEKLSESDRQVLQALVAEETMQTAERKALEQASAEEQKKVAELTD